VNLAAREIREAFSPIATNVSGIEICEHLPGIAPKTIIHVVPPGGGSTHDAASRRG